MDKVYLILGASSDLGCALIRELIANKREDTIKIIAHYYSSKEYIDSLMEEHRDIEFIPMKADLSSLDDTNRLVASIIEKGLEPTHIVHLAANNMRYARFAEWNAESVNKDMTIQVYSFAEVLKAFLPLMAKKNYGKIIVMLTSCTQGIPPKNLSGYVTVKYALLGLVKSIATDFGDQGVNINAISPGMIETKFIRNVGRKIKEFTAEKNPQHRNLNVDDVIPAMLFLLSDDCLFMNGTNLNLSGSTN